ncbi:MAG: KTSC domain-containing protein [Bacteroidota bacterium]
MPIEMQPVESSMLAAYGYEPETSTLAVQFKNGTTIHYPNVPQEVADGFAGESAGKHFNANVRGKFEGVKIEAEKEGEE